MSRIDAAPTPVAPTLYDDGLDHVACQECRPNVALCGVDVSGIEWLPDDAPDTPDDCAVCVELEKFPCPECGL